MDMKMVIAYEHILCLRVCVCRLNSPCVRTMAIEKFRGVLIEKRILFFWFFRFVLCLEVAGSMHKYTYLLWYKHIVLACLPL